jgi:hypothetical protein
MSKWIGQFSKEKVQMNDKCMKKGSSSVAIRELQIKITLRLHLTPARMDINKKANHTCWWGVGRGRNPYELSVGMKISAATMEVSMVFPQGTKNRTIRWSCYTTPGYEPKGTKVNMNRDNYTPMPTVALYNSQVMESANVPNNGWIDKMWCCNRVLSSHERNEIMCVQENGWH